MSDQDRYQFPLLIRSNEVHQYSLVHMLNWAAARGGHGRGGGHMVRISVLDFHCPTSVAGDEKEAEVIPEMPLLRMAFGGVLTVSSLRPRIGGGGGALPSVLTRRGFDANANPLLELYLDSSSLSIRPMTIFTYAPPDDDPDDPPTDEVIARVGNTIGDMLFLAPASTVVWVVQDSWLDQMFYAITTTNIAAPDEPLSPAIRFSNAPSPYLQMTPGSATGGGSVVPPLPLEPFSRAPVRSTPDFFFDVGFRATLPINSGYVGSAAAGQQTILRGYTLGIVLSNVGPATADTTVWSTHLRALVGQSVVNPHFRQYLGWCPQTKRANRVVSLLLDVAIT